MRVIIETQTETESRMVAKMIELYNRQTPAFIKTDDGFHAVHILLKHKDGSALVARDTGSDIDIFTVPSSAIVLEDSVNPENAVLSREMRLSDGKRPFSLVSDDVNMAVGGSIYSIKRVPNMPLWYIQEDHNGKIGKSGYISSPAEACIILGSIPGPRMFC